MQASPRILDCPKCGGDNFYVEEDNVGLTNRACPDCGWYDNDVDTWIHPDPQHPHPTESGFLDLDDLNDFRSNLGEDPLTHEELVAKRMYASVINRRWASPDP